MKELKAFLEELGIDETDIENISQTDEIMTILKVYSNDVEQIDDTYIVNKPSIDTYKLGMILQILFKDKKIEVLKDKVIIHNSENTLESLAEKIDNDYVNIELYENEMVVIGENSVLDEVAEFIDRIDNTLEIVIEDNKIIVKKIK